MLQPQPDYQDSTAATLKTKARADWLRGEFGLTKRKLEPTSLSRFQAVVFQQPAQLLLAANVGQRNLSRLRGQLSSPIALGLKGQFVLQELNERQQTDVTTLFSRRSLRWQAAFFRFNASYGKGLRLLLLSPSSDRDKSSATRNDNKQAKDRRPTAWKST